MSRHCFQKMWCCKSAASQQRLRHSGRDAGVHGGMMVIEKDKNGNNEDRSNRISSLSFFLAENAGSKEEDCKKRQESTKPKKGGFHSQIEQMNDRQRGWWDGQGFYLDKGW